MVEKSETVTSTSVAAHGPPVASSNAQKPRHRPPMVTDRAQKAVFLNVFNAMRWMMYPRRPTWLTFAHITGTDRAHLCINAPLPVFLSVFANMHITTPNLPIRCPNAQPMSRGV